MSREFGTYASGYFHTQMEYAAEDCLKGEAEITRLWGAFLKEFHPVAYSIASSEASDSAPYDPILRSIEQLPALQERLKAIDSYLSDFRRVMEEAVRKRAK